VHGFGISFVSGFFAVISPAIRKTGALREAVRSFSSIGKVSCGVQVRAIPPRAFYDLRNDLSMLCAEVRRKMQNSADFSGELTSIEASLNTFRQVTEKF